MPPWPDEAGLGAHPGVVAAERHGGQQRGGVALADGLLMAELPRVSAEQVDAQVPHPRRLRRRRTCEPGHARATGRRRRDTNRSTTVTSLSAPASMTSRGKHGVPATVDVVGDDDRLGERPCRPAR